ncbi:Spore germination protein B1 [Pelotomaculum sp. FP]|uniref:spore germination protein n=1 Tax=Pelotomaculum sp. FP TaxID=261474 RepID=UPI001102588A|nr:spore germination protein [Pelotomaculum sp. FP]TEB17364.1 Spore germination protein B1 [Pelotomaculum sp. FP]
MFRKPRRPQTLEERKRQQIDAKLAALQPGSEELNNSFSSNLDENVSVFKNLFGNASDLLVREFNFGVRKEIRVALVYIDGLSDRNSINEDILKPFLYRSLSDDQAPLLPDSAYPMIRDWLITFGSIKEAIRINEVLDYVLTGCAALFIDGTSQVLVIVVKGWKARAVEEAKSEAFVRGPRDAFNETLRTSTALVRRRLKTPLLRFDTLQLGRLTKTDISVAYIHGLTDPALKDEVISRLKRIDTDGILESGYLEDFIKDNPWTPFSLLDRTERPDRVAAALMEGRVAILVDTTPFALLVPAVFSEFLQAPEDYYESFDFIRPFRWLGLIAATFLPSVYVALSTYHQEMIPTGLVLSMAAGREGVPFPAVVEALAMEISFDFLREAGARMPRSVGQAVGIVGALILGQAAVAAGIVSPIMVVIVSVAAVASFMIPNYSASFAIRFIRYPFLLLAGAFGLPGIFWGILVLLLHLASLRSFGIPYLYPVAPGAPGEWKDVFFKAPRWMMDFRPSLLRARKLRRQAPGQMPKAPQESSGEGDDPQSVMPDKKKRG